MDMETEVRKTFMDESAELLVVMEDCLLRLEGSPGDQETINLLFRAVHTVKGSSGIVGMEDVERFTHGVESLLSRVRDGSLRVSAEMTGLLLECRDHMAALIEGEPDSDRGAALSGRISGYLGTSPGVSVAEETKAPEAAPAGLWHISLRLSRDVLKNGMDPVSFINYLSKIGEIKSLTTLHDAIPQAHEMDPEVFYLGFEIDLSTEFDKKTIEEVFEFVREDSAIRILPPDSKAGSYVELIESLPEDALLLGEILVRGGAVTRAELDEALGLQASGPETAKRRIGDIMIGEGMVRPEVVSAAAEKQRANASIRAKDAGTIRIEAARLDGLINIVGELVIANENMGQHAARIKDAGLLESASILARLVEALRDDAMQIRMVPIGDTFMRFQRVVRDAGTACGKEAELWMSGGETDLDKTVIEKIADPLMHLVRNAVDHGLERPEERVRNGKPRRGVVKLNAYHDSGSIVIEVSDDGRGLDREKIIKKAVSRGLLAEGQRLTDKEVSALIFEAGFSTAEEVTKLSGRGVGMDVVRRNIESLRGTVEVESAKGEGTTVRIRLPLTLAIIDGFMVGVCGEPYILHLDMVTECIELSGKGGGNKGYYVNHNGAPLPYIRLSEFFGLEVKAHEREHLVVVEYGGGRIGLAVDALYGKVQTVIKSLGRVYRGVKGISGATILGDGTVALILDVAGLAAAFERSKRAA